MITQLKIETYKKFNGNIDGWARSEQNSPSSMSDSDWYLIEELLQDITLVLKGQASETYTISVENKLKENCDNEQTIETLKTLARKNTGM